MLPSGNLLPRDSSRPLEDAIGALRLDHNGSIELIPISIRQSCALPVAFLALTLFTAVTSVAQDTLALSVAGWNQQEGKDGVVYYRCASTVCAEGSVVSYKAQPHRPSVTLQQFEEHHRSLADQNRGTGRIRDVRILDVATNTIDGVRILQVSREVEWSNNTTTYSIEARLIGSERSFSLVSDSPRREWTKNNFEGFLRSLVNFAGLKAG